MFALFGKLLLACERYAEKRQLNLHLKPEALILAALVLAEAISNVESFAKQLLDYALPLVDLKLASQSLLMSHIRFQEQVRQLELRNVQCVATQPMGNAKGDR